jgi:tight adherence protein B
MNPIIILAVAVSLAIIIVIVGIVMTRSEENLIEQRFGRLEEQEAQSFFSGDDEAPSEQESATGADARKLLLNPLNNALQDRKFGKTWRRKLARANIKLTVAEFAALHLVAAAGGFTVGWLVLFSGDPVMSIAAAFLGFFFPRIYVNRTIGKRLINFEEQLPDTLGLWVNAIRSGYSVLQAMEAISKDAPEPTQTEFQRVVQEVQLGIDLPDALEHLLERIESDDLDLVVTAVNIQREVGGNLAEILEVISQTIRERIKLKGEIRVLTSQGRITGYLISFLPISLALFLNASNPTYMGQMFEDRACGWPMIGAGLALIGIGSAIIQKIIDIEI